MKYSVIIIGTGGHARVIIDTLLLKGVQIIGATDKKPAVKGTVINGISFLGTDKEIFNYPSHQVRLVNGLGSVGSTKLRKDIFVYFKSKGYFFESIVHPFVVIANDVKLSEGVQIMAGVVIQTGTRIGENTVLNTRVSIDHDCDIDSHVHLAPGVILSGGVKVEEGAHIGTGAVVIQGVRIGKKSIVGAGAVVIRDVPDGATVIGVPARVIKP